MTHRIVISGHTNIETTLRVDQFPLAYYPVSYPFFGVQSTVSGVGFNIAKALTTLGSQAELFTLVGDDHHADWLESTLRDSGVHGFTLCRTLKETCQSVILYDADGRRQIHTDLKDCQEQQLPAAKFLPALERCDLAILCNINFSRGYLKRAKALGKTVATDVHVLSDLNDDYNQDFLHAADILFLSDEGLSEGHEVFMRELAARFGSKIIVMGRGKQGALLYLRDEDAVHHNPAYHTRDVVNTVGAGDSLFSAFLHYYVQHTEPRLALQRACLFASWKIGVRGAADGFISQQQLEQLAYRSL